MANLFATRLIDINTFSSNNHVDVEISFDKPFTEKVSIDKDNLNHYIFFPKVKVERAKEVSTNNKNYRFIRVFPEQGGMLLKIQEEEDKKINLEISKAQDSYKVRLRIKPKSNYQLGKFKVDSKVGEDVPDMTRNYLISMGFVALLLLIWILTKLFKKSSSTSFFVKNGKNSLKVSVEVQKIIDPQNKIVLIKFAGMNYIVLVGQNNMLLDRYPDKVASSGSKFDTTLKHSQRKLDSLIN